MKGAEEVAKQKEKSPAELLKDEIEKRKTDGRPRKEGPDVKFTKVKLKDAREKLGLKIAWVAEKLGLEPAAISDAEKGKNVRLHVAMSLAKFYGKAVEDLFDGLEVKWARMRNPPEVAQNETGGIPTDPLPFTEETGDIIEESVV